MREVVLFGSLSEGRVVSGNDVDLLIILNSDDRSLTSEYFGQGSFWGFRMLLIWSNLPRFHAIL